MNTCGNCKHWKIPSQGAISVCMRFPPSVNIFTVPSPVVGGPGHQIASLQYPATPPDFPACGEFASEGALLTSKLEWSSE